MSELAELRLAYAECSRQKNELLTAHKLAAADNAALRDEYAKAANMLLVQGDRIKLLEDALRSVAASHAWQLFGESRAFGTDRIPSPGQCHDIARAALEKT